MRPSQFFIRLVVFCCVVFDPSDGGFGILIGVTMGVAIGLVASGLKRLFGRKPDEDA